GGGRGLRTFSCRRGVWNADHLADTRKATAAFARALRFAVGSPAENEILARMSDLHVREKDWRSALTTTQRLAELEPTPEARIERFMRVAEIYRDGFGDSRHAAEALRRASDIDPRNLRLIEALAQLFAGDIPSRRIHLDRALASARGTLAADPFDLGSWSALVRLFDWLESPERAHAAAQVLQLFGGASAESTAILARLGEAFAP